jgi:hypothetical protein
VDVPIAIAIPDAIAVVVASTVDGRIRLSKRDLLNYMKGIGDRRSSLRIKFVVRADETEPESAMLKALLGRT